MDTKLTKSERAGRRLHPIRSWICFALAMTLLFGSIAIALGFAGELYEHRSTILRFIPYAMSFEYHDSDIYWHDMLQYLQYINEVLIGETPLVIYDEADYRYVSDFRFMGGTAERESTDVENIPTEENSDLYAVTTAPMETTAFPDTTSAQIAEPEKPDYYPASFMGSALAEDINLGNISYHAALGENTLDMGTGENWNYALVWSAGELYVLGPSINAKGDVIVIPGTDMLGYHYRDYAPLREYLRDTDNPFGKGNSILRELDPDAVIVLLPSGRIMDDRLSQLAVGQQSIYVSGAICWGIAALIMLIVVLFVGVIIDHRSKAAADAAIGGLLGRIWLEVRLLILFFAGLFYALHITEVDEMVGYTLLIATAWFWVYCITVDLSQNGLRTFTCNTVTTLAKLIRRRADRLPLHRAMSRRELYLVLPLILCGGVGLISLLFILYSYHPLPTLFGFFWLVVSGAGAVYFVIQYFRTRHEDYTHIAAVMERICDIRDGRAGPAPEIPSDHRIAPYADALEGIYAGIERAVAERTRSERTKIEMVTNISHDLKTPLTSIVGYTDLLAGVEGLPDEAADYVAVISQKSARLNGLIKDLFTLTKATTNDLELNIEPLDLTRLLNQLLAEQADAIAAAPVTVVASLPDHECPMESDGTKLYRVFANLLENALRYSLEGSRIFLSLRDAKWADGRSVWRVTVKNTSREYIDFTAEEILARFVRGDKNRSTEGNGLGLPIAKSFTELCGGRFDLTLDGDSFCVTVDLPSTEQ